MDGKHRRQLDWMPGSFWKKPDWRLRRAQYLLETAGRFDQRIDDVLIKRARIEIAKGLAHDRKAPARLSAIQSVHALSRLDHSTMRWRLEAYLSTELAFDEIGAILGLSPAFVDLYHALAYDVRSRPKATDWIARFAMSRAASPDFEYALKVCSRSGGPKILQVTIAIATGAPFPDWVRDSFTNPAFDDAVLRMRGKLTIGGMLARTREQWRALVVLRRRLRRAVPSTKGDKSEARLQVMLSLLTKVAPSGSALVENQPLREPEPVTPTTTTPGDPRSPSRSALGEKAQFHPAPVSVQGRRKSRGHQQQDDAAAAHDPEGLHPEIVEFLKEDAEGTGSLAFMHIEIEETKWLSFDDGSEPRIATVSIHI